MNICKQGVNKRLYYGNTVVQYKFHTGVFFFPVMGDVARVEGRYGGMSGIGVHDVKFTNNQ